jgi:hypothetical protein
LEEFTVQWARICHQFCLIFGSHIPTEHFNAISSPLEKKKRGKRELYTYLKSNYPYQKQFSRGLEMLFKTTAGDMI